MMTSLYVFSSQYMKEEHIFSFERLTSVNILHFIIFAWKITEMTVKVGADNFSVSWPID